MSSFTVDRQSPKQTANSFSSVTDVFAFDSFVTPAHSRIVYNHQNACSFVYFVVVLHLKYFVYWVDYQLFYLY